MRAANINLRACSNKRPIISCAVNVLAITFLRASILASWRHRSLILCCLRSGHRSCHRLLQSRVSQKRVADGPFGEQYNTQSRACANKKQRKKKEPMRKSKPAEAEVAYTYEVPNWTSTKALIVLHFSIKGLPCTLK